MVLKARSSNEGIHKSKTFDCKVKKLAIKLIMNGVLLKLGDVEAQQNVVTKLMDSNLLKKSTLPYIVPKKQKCKLKPLKTLRHV
jgi:hypothetical protein